MPFWSLPYLLENSNCQPLLIRTSFTPKTTQQRCAQSPRAQCQQEGDTPRWGYILRRYMAWIPIRGLWKTTRGHKEQFFVSAWRPRKLSFKLKFTPFFWAWEALSIPLILSIIFKRSALTHKKPIRLLSNYMLVLCSMHTNWQQLDTPQQQLHEGPHTHHSASRPPASQIPRFFLTSSSLVLLIQ